MKKVDLNVDIGEGFPHDERLLEFATSANVCCGEHAGSWMLTLDTIDLCERRGVRIGMHPGFPDREHMGRRIPKREELEDIKLSVRDQVLRFLEYRRPAYIKPHGALYSILTSNEGSGDPIVDAVCGAMMGAIAKGTELPLMLLAGSKAAKLIDEGGSPVILEGFADRAYAEDGSLVPRSEPGAVLHDPNEIAAQVLRLAPNVDSICLHGDTEGCVELARLVRKTLEDAGYEVGY